jgi:hypothetical protein
LGERARAGRASNTWWGRSLQGKWPSGGGEPGVGWLESTCECEVGELGLAAWGLVCSPHFYFASMASLGLKPAAEEPQVPSLEGCR